MTDPDADAKVLYALWAADLDLLRPWHELPPPSQELWRRIAERFRRHVTDTTHWTDIWSEVEA